MKNTHLQTRSKHTLKKLSLKFILVTLLLIQVAFIHAQLNLVSSVTNEGEGTSAHVNRPFPASEGDLLVLGFMVEKGNGVTITPPSGWKLILETNNSTNAGMSTYYRVVEASEPSIYTFNFSTSSKWSSGTSRITGADPSFPIDASNGKVGDSNPVEAPSVFANSDNALVLCFYTNKKAATYTQDVSTAKIYDDPNEMGGLPSNMMALFFQPKSGHTDEKFATASESESWAAQQVVIAELLALPVDLVSFTGHAMERSNMLKWQTASEENTKTFIVERSLDGVNNYSEIDRIDAQGNSSEMVRYEIEDLNPGALSYYRLRIVDFDEKYEFSDIIAVQQSTAEIDQVEVFPVPAKEEVTILVHAKTDGNAIMIISDFMGRKIKEEKIVLKTGINRYDLNWNGLESNFYYLTIDKGGEKITKKILRAIND